MNQRRTVGKVSSQRDNPAEPVTLLDNLEKEGEDINQFFQSQKIDKRKFQLWSQNYLMEWIAYELIPEIINENQKNFQNIGADLEKFNCFLVDQNCWQQKIKSFYDTTNLAANSSNANRNQKGITLQKLLNNKFDSANKNVLKFDTFLFKSKAEFDAAMASLWNNIKVRARLDRMFEFQGFNIQDTRIHILQLLERL